MRPRMVCVMSSLLLLPLPVAAQTDPAAEATRQGYARRMQECADAGDWACVVEQGTLAGRIRPSTSLTMWLAIGYQHQGQLLEALDAGTRCQVQARADASNPDRGRIVDQCDAIVRDVEQRVGRIVVRVPAPAPAGLEVSVRGVALPPALWGVGYPVLPGSVLVEARSRDGGTFTSRVEVPAGELREARVELVRPPVRPVQPRAPEERSGAGIGPWVVVGAGGVALLTSAVLLGLHAAAMDARDGVCPADDRTVCDDDQYALGMGHHARAEGYGTASLVMLGIGASAVAGGLLWYFVARPSNAARRTTWRLDVVPGQGGAFVNVGGTL